MKRVAFVALSLAYFAVPATAQLPDTEWSLHGRDSGEQRYSELAQITTDASWRNLPNASRRREHAWTLGPPFTPASSLVPLPRGW